MLWTYSSWSQIGTINNMREHNLFILGLFYSVESLFITTTIHHTSPPSAAVPRGIKYSIWDSGVLIFMFQYMKVETYKFTLVALINPETVRRRRAHKSSCAFVYITVAYRRPLGVLLNWPSFFNHPVRAGCCRTTPSLAIYFLVIRPEIGCLPRSSWIMNELDRLH